MPQKLLVGEMNDLVIGVGANAGVGEIGFTVQFDASVLQVRAASQGDWAVDVGVNPRFAAEISGAEDRVQIRSAVSGQRVGRSGGSVAVVQFQPVAPGTTSVLITDVVVKDARRQADDPRSLGVESAGDRRIRDDAVTRSSARAVLPQSLNLIA